MPATATVGHSKLHTCAHLQRLLLVARAIFFLFFFFCASAHVTFARMSPCLRVRVCVWCVCACHAFSGAAEHGPWDALRVAVGGHAAAAAERHPRHGQFSHRLPMRPLYR